MVPDIEEDLYWTTDFEGKFLANGVHLCSWTLALIR